MKRNLSEKRKFANFQIDTDFQEKVKSGDCRLRKPSQTHEKLEEQLKTINEKNEDFKPKFGLQRPSKPMSEKIDYVGNFLGPIGKFQIRTIFLVYLTKIPASWFMSCVSFGIFQVEIFLMKFFWKFPDHFHRTKWVFSRVLSKKKNLTSLRQRSVNFLKSFFFNGTKKLFWTLLN